MVLLTTSRLTIRNFGADDWHALQGMILRYQASEWAKYEDPWPTSDEKMREIANWFASGEDYLAVCLKETGVLIGFIAIGRRQEAEGRIHNLGYIFDPDYSGQGYATEGCRACMDYVFGSLSADGILTGTHPDNTPSVRLLDRLGLKAIGEGEYAISRAEWLEKRQGQGT
jgi:RimJ/RimL family protein N-acetyltransferase